MFHHTDIKNIAYVGFGGVLGALLRYGFFELTYGLVSIFIINIIGSFLLGILMYSTEFGYVNPYFRVFVGIGFLGSLTTFSHFAFQSYIVFTHSLAIFTIYIVLNILFAILSIHFAKTVFLLISKGGSV